VTFVELCERLAAHPPGPDDSAAALVQAAPEAWRPGLEALLDGPDPTEALHRAAALPPVADGISPRLARLLHEGPYPGRLVTLSPEAAAVLDVPEGPRRLDTRVLVDQLAARIATDGLDVALGRIRTREYLRLCAREVEGAPLEEVGGDLTTLTAAFAEACLVHEGIASEVCVLGMGKLGGHELNFLSDIDLIFVHDDDAPRVRVVELHQALRRVVRALEGSGSWRPLFRVDLRLRPFGRTGPLSMSVRATEAYYERHGRDWERQVWIKARPLAGAKSLGDTIVARLRPFVYRRSVTESIFAEISELMERARTESETSAPGRDGPDVKLDPGGIRQIEFGVQALQLLHGGRRPALRTPSTLIALDRLLGAGLVSAREHEDLVTTYRALRRIEHRVQLAGGQQTHRVPADAGQLDHLRRCLTRGAAPIDLDATLCRDRARVRQIAQTFAGDVTADPRRRDVTTALDAGAPQGARRAALARLGLHDPDEAEAQLAHLAGRRDGPLVAAGPSLEGAHALAAACLDAADPDAAIAGLARFAEHRGPHYAIWRAFADPAARPAVRLAAELLGSAPSVALGLVGVPVGRGALPDDAFDLLMTIASDALPRAEDHEAAWPAADEDPRGLDAKLLRFKHRQLARVALHDLERRPDPLDVGRSLSDLADFIVRQVLVDLARSFAPTAPFRIATLAVGKYGMRATDYGSDLDVMFVFDAVEGTTTAMVQADAIRFGQQLVARLVSRQLGPRLFEVDTRLRPSGRQGLLVTSVGGFAHYHAGALPVWERLANIRLRAIAEVVVGPDAPGDGAPAELATTCTEAVHRSLGWHDGSQPPATPEEVARGVRDLLRRIADEVSREDRRRGYIDAKSGPGGCLELELLVAALQLLHGAATPGARTASVVEALEALGGAGVLDLRTWRQLTSDYRFLRQLLNRLRLTRPVAGDDPDRFSENSPRLVTLARRMGLVDEQSLLQELHRCREHVRQTVDQHLSPATDGS
jgi:glutamate-ammonia-ligase adenylyltransferase